MLQQFAMAILEIKKYPDAVLRNRTAAVRDFDARLDRLIEDMIETMYAAPGVGLAANQVGVPLRLAVIDVSSREEDGQKHPLLVLANPEVLCAEGWVTEEEGCLSIPGFTEKVKRAARVTVRAQDRRGASFELEADGLLAKALQHEIDHLNGVLFVDRLSPLKRDLFKRRHRKTLAQQT